MVDLNAIDLQGRTQTQAYSHPYVGPHLSVEQERHSLLFLGVTKKKTPTPENLILKIRGLTEFCQMCDLQIKPLMNLSIKHSSSTRVLTMKYES